MLKLTLLEKLFFACICTHFAVLSAAKVMLFFEIKNKLYLNSAVFFLVRKFYMLRCLLGALYFDMRRFGVFWVFSKHKIPRPNQWGSMKNHKK